jgi:Zn-finger nucleic acid-binding protein
MIPFCPKCHVGLIILNFKGIEVDYCEGCRGVWLDHGELEQLMTRTGARAGDPILQFQQKRGRIPKGSKRLCPRCDEPLEEIMPDSELVLDRCPRGHGLWFDADELKQLLSLFPADSGTSHTVDFLNEVFGISVKT